MTITHHTQDQIHRNRPPVVALIFYSTFVCFIVTFSMQVLILEAPSRTRLWRCCLKQKQRRERAMIHRRRRSTVFEFPPLPLCAWPRRVCTLLLCLPTCAALPRCYLLWLALLDQQARPSHQLSFLMIIKHALAFLPFPPTQHTAYSICPPDDKHGRSQHGRGCSKRKVRGGDHVEAVL